MHKKEPQELPEHTSEHVKSQNFLEACPPDPPHTIHFVGLHLLYLPWAPSILSAALDNRALLFMLRSLLPGLCEWTDCPGALQLEDTPRLTYPLVSAPPPHSPPAIASSSSHSSLSVQPESTRFKVATEEELSTFAKGLVPENTTRSTKCALNTINTRIQ